MGCQVRIRGRWDEVDTYCLFSFCTHSPYKHGSPVGDTQQTTPSHHTAYRQNSSQLHFHASSQHVSHQTCWHRHQPKLLRYGTEYFLRFLKHIPAFAFSGAVFSLYLLIFPRKTGSTKRLGLFEILPTMLSRFFARSCKIVHSFPGSSSGLDLAKITKIRSC